MQKLDPRDGSLGAETSTKGVLPRGCALGADDSLLAVADYDTDDLVIFNASDLSIKAAFTVGLGPHAGPRNTLITRTLCIRGELQRGHDPGPI